MEALVKVFNFRNLFSLALVGLSLLLFNGPTIAALTPAQKRVIDSGSLYFNTEIGTQEACGGGSGAGTGKVYMIGDSITEGTVTELTAAFTGKGFSAATIDGLSSRRLSAGGEPLDGLSVLANSVDQFKDASTIIVALGTNGGLTTANIQQAVDTIKGANPTAKIFFVNIGVVNELRSDPLEADGWNSVLNEQKALGYSVIDWASALGGNQGYIADDGLGVHPTGDGKQAFANTVASGATGAGGGSCGCSVGDDNQRGAFNFLTQKGLTPAQAAGVVGNMIAESGVLPTRLQSTPPETITPSDTILNRLDEGIGWGIVQWTPPGKMIRTSSEKGVPYSQIDTLCYQLEFLWGQLTGTGVGGEASNEKSAGDRLKATTTVEEAAASFAIDYERCADCSANSTTVNTRITLAIDVLNKYGSGGTTT